jgi:hypothetical protein
MEFPLNLNMLLGRDYVYDRNYLVSTIFHVMHFSLNGSIVTINQLACIDTSPHSTLDHVSPFFVSSVSVDTTSPKVNHVASYPMYSIDT